jgi:DNA-binding NarL/FixJ family response regulator
MQALSEDFVTAGTQAGVFELVMPDRQRLRAASSPTVNLSAATHISVLDPQQHATRGSAARSGIAGQTLSPRERDVLALVAIGETGHTIAAQLCISRATVETYIRKCLAKLGAKNRPHAVVLALKRGDISLT